MPPDLTPTRRAVLHAVSRLGTQATLSAVAAACGISKQAVSQHLPVLRRGGLLGPPGGRYAPLELTARARAVLGLGLPIYGQIAAGVPGLAEQEPGDFTPSIEALLGQKPGDFLLRVRGQSMAGIGVMDGDYVLVRPAETVDDGEVAVVLIPGENAATLKRVYAFGDTVTLISEHPDHPRMVYPAGEVQIQGRMVGRIGRGAPRAGWSRVHGVDGG